MSETKFRVFMIYLGLNVLLFCLMIGHSVYSRKQLRPMLEEQAGLVKRYGLTDLCLFTDARYTRHPAMADMNTPFQDYPMSFEHFPSGALIPPPPHLVSHGLD